MRVIGDPLDYAERVDFQRCVRSFINVPFGHQRRRSWKLDCAGLLLVSMQGFGRNVPFTEDPVGALIRVWSGRPTIDLPAYGRTPFKDGLQRVMRENLGDPVSGPIQAADVVLMRFKGEPQHVGMIADYPGGGLRLIHTDSAVGRVTEHIFGGSWPDTVFEVYRP